VGPRGPGGKQERGQAREQDPGAGAASKVRGLTVGMGAIVVKGQGGAEGRGSGVQGAVAKRRRRMMRDEMCRPAGPVGASAASLKSTGRMAGRQRQLGCLHQGEH
jgi:hypothetical protein